MPDPIEILKQLGYPIDFTKALDLRADRSKDFIAKDIWPPRYKAPAHGIDEKFLKILAGDFDEPLGNTYSDIFRASIFPGFRR